ncbi:MAG: ABC transporter ATP-binding protein [Deltaproteobacteria bacterium]|jgi:ABC-2 type transport system ATP-binding protein|nr:ABC transporter ATP-binding protein [Deltaproteobacteria bacterium]
MPEPAEKTAPNPPAILADGVTRAFGSFPGVKDISLEIARGDRVALVGPNGAGKSTLMRLLAGALTPDSGKILLKGLPPGEARTVPGFLGWLPERAPLNAELTVREHLRLAGKLRNLARARIREETERLTLALNLESKLDRLAGNLSLGGRRQAALAVAFLGNPELLVLDEPSSSLDPDQAGRLALLLGALPPETTVLVSSHNLGEVRGVTDRVIVMNGGEIGAAGQWEELAAERGLTETGTPATPEELFFEILGEKE